MAVGRTPSGGTHRCWSITLGLIVAQEPLEAIPAQEAILRRARGWAANHASGNNSASRSIEWVGSRSSTSFRYANGSPPSRLQLATKLHRVAAVRPPRSLPTNKSSFDRLLEHADSVPSDCCRYSARRRGCTSASPPTGPGHRRSPGRSGSWAVHDLPARPATLRTPPGSAPRPVAARHGARRPTSPGRCPRSGRAAGSGPAPRGPAPAPSSGIGRTCGGHGPSTPRGSPPARHRSGRSR